MTASGQAPQALAPHLDALWPDDSHRLLIRRRPRLWDRAETYLLVPRPARPTALLPTAPAAAAAAALSSYGHASTRTARVRSRVLGLLARLGAARLVPGTLVVTPRGEGGSLLTTLTADLGEQVHASVRLGPPRANRKPVLTLMRKDGTIMGYTKVGTNELTRARIEAETAALRELAAAQLGSLVVPDVLTAGRWRDASYLTLSPLATRSGGAIDIAVRDASARDLVAAFPVRSERLASAPWWHALRERLGAISSDDAGALDRRATELARLLGETTLIFGAQHGDWTPWNLHTVGDATHVWDWERFATGAPVGTDQLHYAFHTATALGGVAPATALARIRSRLPELVQLHRIADPAVLWAVYLVQAGERFVSDRQEDAGSQKGPLTTWLLPVLDLAITDLSTRG